MPRRNDDHANELVDDRGLGHAASSPALVDVTPTPKAMHRRSSMSVAPLAALEPAVSPAKSPVLSHTGGDQVARPHFLKDRSMTMRERLVPSSSTPAIAVASQSRAGSFLAHLVERSRSSTFESKPTTTAVVSPSATTADTGPQRRRQSIVLTEAALSRLGPQRPAASTTVRAGSTTIHSIQEDPEDAAFLAELLTSSLPQLVTDLSLYRTRANALRLVLDELRRRLEAAEPAALVSLCRELVDGGLLPGVVLAMREFRFHAALQTAALALLSLLADVSDLYALEMAELDVAPLVHKAVAVHVSDERLVMAGSSLAHAITESRHKRHVLQMHRERRREKERMRAASLVEAFVAAERKTSKVRTLGDERPPSRLPSRWLRRSTIAADLGSPPMLTSHYDLEVSAFEPRPSLLEPLSRSNEPAFEDLRLEPFVRPKTSPDFRSLHAQASAAKTIAVYSQAQSLVAPSPLKERTKEARKTQSAAASTRRTISTRRNLEGVTSRSKKHEYGANDGCVVRTGELESKTTGDEHQADSSSCPQKNESENVRRSSKSSKDQAGRDEEGDSDDDPAYDEDDFDPEDPESEGENLELLALNNDRVLPVGSDSDLFDLVDHSEADIPSSVEQSEAIDLSVAVASSPLSELVLDANDASGVGDVTNAAGGEQVNDPVTAELVGLLSACIDSSNPISSIPDGGFPLSPSIVPEPKAKRRIKRPARSSPVVSSWVPPTTIVRPVSRRIMDKTEKKSMRKQLTRSQSPKPPREPLVDRESIAQVTTILETVHNPDSNKLESTPDKSEKRAAIGFIHSPPPPSTPTTSISQIHALYARGLQHHKANELDEAVRCYEQGIHLQHSSGVNREFASLYINLGSARLAQQRPYDALVAFTQAERVQPHNTKALFNSGLVLMQLSKYSEAIGKFELVVTLDRSHVRAQSLLEQCQRAAGESTQLPCAGI